MNLELAGLARATRADGSKVALGARDAALLAWLAIEGATSRARLADLLWPESGADAARNTLRQRLFHLRKHCGELVTGGAVLRLAEGVRHDLTERAGLLGELHFLDAPELAAWLEAQRTRRAGEAQVDLEREVRRLEEAGELAAALSAAQDLLRRDGLSEASHRLVMRLHYLRGDRAAALLAFDRCERTLKDEVGTRPSPETLALLQTIERADPHSWRPGQALPASALRPPRLIGRDAELGALAHAWAAQRLFLVSGQAGAGKSRLLEALAESEPGALLVRARPGDDKVPLATLDRLVQRLGERWPAILAAPAYGRFVARLSGPAEGQPPSVQSVTPLVAELLRLARLQEMEALVLDDLQFADNASFDIWQELLAWPALAGLRFGFASRVEGEAAATRIAALNARGETRSVALPPLDASSVQPLVESLGLAGVDAAAVAAALVRRIGGNPLHLLETIRHALEKHGQLRADALEAPARVAELLEQRLLALEPDGLLIARIAAVAGHEFGPELAAVVSRRDVLELADAWHALERQGLLDARGFMHDLIGEAAHRLLPQPIARVLHGRVAAHLADRGASPARLAHHLLCAGDEVAAVPHLVLAARQAWHLGRSRETCEAFFRAAAIEAARGRPEAAFDLLFDCAESLTELGPAEAFRDVVERLQPLAHTPSQRARVFLFRAVARHQEGDDSGFLVRIDEALALAVASGDAVVEAECHFAHGYCAAYEGRLQEGLRHLARAEEVSRLAGREARATAVGMNMDLLFLWTGRARLALERQQALQTRLGAEGQTKLLAQVIARQAVSEVHLGEFDAAWATARRGLEAMRVTDMIATDFAADLRMGIDVLRRCGHWAEALEAFEESRERLQAEGDPQQRVAETLADVYLDLGRPELAHRQIEIFAGASQYLARPRQRLTLLRWRYRLATGAAIETAAEVAEAMQSENLLMACELVLLAGRAAAPEPTADACAALAARCEREGLREQLLPLVALCAWLRARTGETAAAEADLAHVERLSTQGDVGAATPLCGLWLIRALRALGRPGAAAATAQRTLHWLVERARDDV
ncbi:MAG: AAA family ATPase, partial [Caldimonas sp.]